MKESDGIGILQECGLVNYFSPIVMSEIVDIEKPDRRIIEIALNKLKLPTTSCVYIGDQPFDSLCAKSIDMDVVWKAERDSIIPKNLQYKKDCRIESV